MKIEIRNLKKRFNDNFVLKDISLTVEKNKSTIILGQSGCGNEGQPRREIENSPALEK